MVPQIDPARRGVYHNPSAREWTTPAATPTNNIAAFHRSLPSYAPTELIPLPEVAQDIGVGAVYLKNESQRCGLPSFKILGASWAACRAIAAHRHLPLNSELQTLAAAAQTAGIVLIAATEGNHGRAVARMAGLLGLKARIFVSKSLSESTAELIRGEGAEIEVVNGDYDLAVGRAMEVAEEKEERILVQDTSFDGYQDIPRVSSPRNCTQLPTSLRLMPHCSGLLMAIQLCWMRLKCNLVAELQI